MTCNGFSFRKYTASIKILVFFKKSKKGYFMALFFKKVGNIKWYNFVHLLILLLGCGKLVIIGTQSLKELLILISETWPTEPGSFLRFRKFLRNNIVAFRNCTGGSWRRKKITKLGKQVQYFAFVKTKYLT